MNDRTKHDSEWNVVPDRDDLTRFEPLVLAALWRAGMKRDVTIAVDQILAVLEEGGWNIPAMTWGDLCAVVVAVDLMVSADPRTWRGRARSLKIPSMIGLPRMSEGAEFAVADDTLHELAERMAERSADADPA